MAQNENINVNINVTGSAQIKEAADASKKLGDQINDTTQKLDKNTEAHGRQGEEVNKTKRKMTEAEMGFRNFSFQIQDMAVQLEMGTDAFRVMGQQLPQLLGSFGTIGIALGAVFGVGIPLARLGLSALGFEMRDVNEIAKNLSEDVKTMNEAQKENLTTVEGLRVKYGELAESVKKYNESNEKISTTIAQSQLTSEITKLRKEYLFLGDDLNSALNKANDSLKMTGEIGTMAFLGLSSLWTKFTTGLNDKQIQILGENLKKLDKDSSPKQILETIALINEELIKTGLSATKIEEIKNSLEPMRRLAEAAKDMNKNINDAADKTSVLNTQLLGIQAQYITKIGDAQRSYNQQLAINLQRNQKFEELTAHQNQLEKDGLLTSYAKAEIRAKENIIIKEAAEKLRDFEKAQQETYYAQQLSNEAKLFQLQMEGKILGIQNDLVTAFDYESYTQQKILRNIYDQQQALFAVGELRRKNQITEERALKLQEQISEIRKQSDANAALDAEKIRTENAKNMNQQIYGIRRENEDRQRQLNLIEEVLDKSTLRAETERKLADISSQQRRVEQEIIYNSRLSIEERTRQLERVNEAYQKSRDLAEEEYRIRKRIDESAPLGANQRMKELSESFSNFKIAGMAVDAVWNNMGSALDKFVETGKLSFGDFARSVIMDLTKIALKASAMQFLKAAYGSMGGGEGILGGIKSLFGFAEGGDPPVGVPSIVGERGPELFVPKTAGTIMPAGSFSSATRSPAVTNVYNISAVDAKSVAQLFYENRHTMFGTVEAARKEMPMRR